jgi:hypothetical protein
MVLRIVWTHKALADLRAIKDFISRDSKRYAELQGSIGSALRPRTSDDFSR